MKLCTPAIAKSILLGLLAIGILNAATAADLAVRIRNIQSAEGQIIVSLHGDDADWPEPDNAHQPSGNYVQQNLAPKPGEIVAVFNDIKPGRYAVRVLHDENGDGKLNRQILLFTGMPKEPYAFSNDSWSLLSAAGFQKASFEMGTDTLEVPVWLSTHLQKIGGNDSAPVPKP